ncbi:MAG: replicative DNA helicase [Victivallaceae bacterium]|jgi:replicative DNA helicase
MADKKENLNRKKIPGVIAEDRPQPHNLEAEKAVIAAMLREPHPCVDIAVELLHNEEVFYSHIHREIFKAVKDIYDNAEMSVDLISIAHQLARSGKLEDIGGEVFLAELYGSISTTVNIETWCEIVHEFSVLRNMINVCSESLLKCYDVESDVKALVDEIESKIYDVRNKNTKSDIIEIRHSIEAEFKNVMKVINKEVEVGIPSGFPDLDKLVIGFKPGEMFVLAARPSIGKTSLALNFIRNVALRGSRQRPVAFFSLEMTAEQITRRLLCTEAQISETRFFDGSFKNHEMPKLTQAVGVYKNAKIFIDPTGGLTISELRAKARRLRMMEKIELIVIDYLQLMHSGDKTESRQQEVADISSGIKRLAKDLSIPILVLAQLNREVEKTAGPSARPKLSHLRESGAIEQDADIVAFLHRDRDETKNKTLNKEEMKNGVDALLIVEKNRNGQTGTVDLSFFPHRMEFVNKSKFGDDDRPPEKFE